MKRLACAVLSVLPAWVLAQGPSPEQSAAVPGGVAGGKLLLIEARERALSDLQNFQTWEQQLGEVSELGVAGVVLHLDSEGGQLEATLDLMRQVAQLPVPSVAFVEGKALGPAVLLALASDRIYVTQGALLGGGVVESSGEGGEEQSKSILAARVRGAVGGEVHRQEVMEALLFPAAERRDLGGLSVSKGEVLTLTGAEAAALPDRNGPFAVFASDLAGVLEREGWSGASWVDPDAEAAAEPAVVPPSERPGVSREENEDAKPAKTEQEESFEGKIVILSVGEDDLMNTQSFKFWRRMLRRAEEEGAKAVVFDLDTPGGRAFETSDLMTELTRLKVPSYAFVNPNAISAGALISVATDGIYVSPDARIGAAGLVSGMGEIEDMMRKKLHSVFEAQLRTVAEKKGHDPELIRAMMIPDEKNDRVFGKVVVPKGALLTLNASEAVSLRDGKPLLAKSIVNSVEEIAKMEGWEGVPIVRAEATPFERFAWWVAKYSFILILIGMGAAYAEMKTPGFGVGGAISLTAFGIFFFGNYAAGNLAGYEMVALFVLGVVLVLVEILLIPGTGLAGIAGVLCIMASLLFGMVDKIEWGDWQGGEFSGNILDLLRGPVLSLGAGLLGGSILVLILMRFLPSVPIFNFLIAEKELAGGASLPETAGAGHAERVGWTGEAITDLRPAGKAQFGDDAFDVVADDGAFVEKGSRVRIVEEDGMRVVVAKVAGP